MIPKYFRHNNLFERINHIDVFAAKLLDILAEIIDKIKVDTKQSILHIFCFLKE